MDKSKFTKENFRLVEERKDCTYDCKVRIFTRNKGIGELPDRLKKYIYDVYPIYSTGDIHWVKGNCDKGSFDAVLVIHSTKDCVDVFVCGILRRPFTDEEANEYEKYFKEDINYRLTKIYDNKYESEI